MVRLIDFTAVSMSCHAIRFFVRSHFGRKSRTRALRPLPRFALETVAARIAMRMSSRAGPMGPVICSYAIHSVSSADECVARSSRTDRPLARARRK